MKRRAERAGVSESYARRGPSSLDVLPYSREPGRVREILDEWSAWRDEHGAAWDAGDDVPPPPYADEFDTADGVV